MRRFAVAEQHDAEHDRARGPAHPDHRLAARPAPRRARSASSAASSRFPGTRAKFTNTTGSIDFAENEHASNPHLDITSEATDYLDLSGQQHIITLDDHRHARAARCGTSRPRPATTSRRRSRCSFLGRNPEQLRRSLGDQSLGSTPTISETSTNPSAGFADQIVKDLAGDWVSEPARRLADASSPASTCCASRSASARSACTPRRRRLENIRALGDAEQTIRGHDDQRARRASRRTLHLRRPGRHRTIASQRAGRLAQQELLRPGRARYLRTSRASSSTGCSFREARALVLSARRMPRARAHARARPRRAAPAPPVEPDRRSQPARQVSTGARCLGSTRRPARSTRARARPPASSATPIPWSEFVVEGALDRVDRDGARAVRADAAAVPHDAHRRRRWVDDRGADRQVRLPARRPPRRRRRGSCSTSRRCRSCARSASTSHQRPAFDELLDDEVRRRMRFRTGLVPAVGADAPGVRAARGAQPHRGLPARRGLLRRRRDASIGRRSRTTRRDPARRRPPQGTTYKRRHRCACPRADEPARARRRRDPRRCSCTSDCAVWQRICCVSAAAVHAHAVPGGPPEAARRCSTSAATRRCASSRASIRRSRSIAALTP